MQRPGRGAAAACALLRSLSVVVTAAACGAPLTPGLRGTRDRVSPAAATARTQACGASGSGAPAGALWTCGRVFACSQVRNGGATFSRSSFAASAERDSIRARVSRALENARSAPTRVAPFKPAEAEACHPRRSPGRAAVRHAERAARCGPSAPPARTAAHAGAPQTSKDRDTNLPSQAPLPRSLRGRGRLDAAVRVLTRAPRQRPAALAHRAGRAGSPCASSIKHGRVRRARCHAT